MGRRAFLLVRVFNPPLHVASRATPLVRGFNRSRTLIRDVSGFRMLGILG